MKKQFEIYNCDYIDFMHKNKYDQYDLFIFFPPLSSLYTYAIRRSHRYGRVGVLDVIVPVSEPEEPVWELLQKKILSFKKDVLELQSRFFKYGN